MFNTYLQDCLDSAFFFLLIFIINFFSGDASNQVHMEGYGVSNQCMALVRDNCLIPTKDPPELVYIRESTDKQYVPDVYYKVSAWRYY
jgi:nuclear protein localization family protein 4